MRENIGRNDLCPCGSGKKYKRCCLEAQAPSQELLWRRQRDAADQLTHKLMRFAAQRFGNCLEEAWQDFNMDDVPTFLEEGSQARSYENQIFMPYFLFHWDPDFLTSRKPAQGGMVAREYLRKRAYDLRPMERSLLEQATTQPVSFYEVLWSKPDERLGVRDILIGGETEVLERSGSQSLCHGDIVYGQVWNLPDLALFGYVAPHVIPPGRKANIIALRSFLRETVGKRKVLAAADLCQHAPEIRATYLIVRELLHSPPKLCNTDGDPLVLHTLTFSIESAQEALEALAPLAENRSRDELFDDAERDKEGQICKASFDWVKMGKNRRISTWDNTILGYIKIEENSLVAEVNSKKRAGRLRKEIEVRLGPAAVHKSTAAQTAEEAMNHYRKSKSKDAGARSDNRDRDEVLIDPEVRKHLEAALQRQVEAWVHQKIPILGGQTPLQAVRDPDGREIIESLLLEWERQQETATSSGRIRSDFGALRRLLNLPAPAQS